MKKNLFLSIILLLSFVFGFTQSPNKKSSNKKNQVASCLSKPSKETLALRKKHANFLKNSPFKYTKTLSKKESFARGLTPNKYFEENWELTMNPETGRPTTENLIALRKQLDDEKLNTASRNPGDAANNSWIERGPTNVGGRTRAVIFDPNDTTNETVFAGGVSGGLWKNTNISNPNSVWTRVAMPENLAVSCIAVDPNNSQIFYVGTGESYVGGDVNGDGLWKSINGGLTWTNVFGGVSGATYFNSASNLTINSPASLVGNMIMVEAPTSFSTAPRITTTPAFSYEIVYQNDLPANPAAIVCDPFPNPELLVGKIALIRRGNCPFTSKVKAAQTAGAVGVIIMNNNTDLPFGMGGTDNTITIPAVMISTTDGNILQNALLSGAVTVTLNQSDGSFTGNMVPGVQHINDVKIRNNAGVSEIYLAAGDTNYRSAGTITYLGGTSYGLYKSVNGGTNWNKLALPLTSGGKEHCPNDIEFTSDNKVWLSTLESSTYGEGGGVVLSSSDGTTFVPKYTVQNGDRTQIAVSKTNANKIYVLAEVKAVTATASPATVSFVSTNDSFATTTILALPNDADGGIPDVDFTRGQAGYDLVLEVSPVDDQKLFTGGINIFDSSDGGTSWNQKSKWMPSIPAAVPEVHADQHAASFAPGAANKMVFGNDGGVYYSSDSGVTISDRNTGFNVTQFYSLGVAPTNNGMPGDNFVAGAQDNGSQMFLNVASGQNSSTEVQGGDGAYSMFDQDGVDQYRITNYVYNNTVRLFNYVTGATRNINSETLGSANGDNGAFISPMALDSRLDILYSDYTKTTNNRVRRYKNIKFGSFQKAPLTNGLLNSAPTALTVSPFAPSAASTSTLLVGTRSGRLLKVTNADLGTTAADPLMVWTNLTGPGFAGSVSDVEYGATENDIYVTFHNYNVVSIWYTADGGVTWQNKEGNFPDIPVKCILRNPLELNEVIIGTDLGVWGTTNFNSASPTWTRSDNGMQNVRVTDMDMRNDFVVYAATYGRGVFSGAFSGILSNNKFTKENKNVTISPNPANGKFNINVKDFSGKVNIQIIDINGKLISTIKEDNFNSQKSIDISNIQTGIYLVKLSGENLDFTDKLIIN